MYKCNVCNKEYENKYSFLGHCSVHKRKIKEKLPKNTSKRIAWNKGLSKETNEAVKRNSEAVRKTLKQKVLNGTFVVPIMSNDARQKLSIEQSLHNRGGKCKWYEVGGMKVQGTWERDLALHFEKLNINWYKPSQKIDLVLYKDDKGNFKSYSPDFYLKDIDFYIEVKGFWWGDDKRKMQLVFLQTDKKISLILKDNLKLLLSLKTKEELYGAVAKEVYAGD